MMFSIILAYVLVNNVILSRFLGLCPFIGVSHKRSAALTMGLAATFVMSMAAFLSSFVYYNILIPLEIQWLRLLFFMLLIVFLVQLSETLLEKYFKLIHAHMGIYLPLMSSNCAVLGVVLWNLDVDQFTVAQSFVAGLGAGLGFTLVLLLMSTIRERLERVAVPQFMQGQALAFLIAALMAMVFSIFDQALIERLIYGW